MMHGQKNIKLSNIIVFTTAALVTRRRLHVTLYLHCLSCCEYKVHFVMPLWVLWLEVLAVYFYMDKERNHILGESLVYSGCYKCREMRWWGWRLSLGIVCQTFWHLNTLGPQNPVSVSAIIV